MESVRGLKSHSTFVHMDRDTLGSKMGSIISPLWFKTNCKLYCYCEFGCRKYAKPTDDITVSPNYGGKKTVL